jgi:hypothetical protein
MTRKVKLTTLADFHTHEGEEDWKAVPDDATKALEELLQAIDAYGNLETDEPERDAVLAGDRILNARDKFCATSTGAALIRQAEEER